MAITSSFDYHSTALEVAAGHDLHGRHALVTGAASGIKGARCVALLRRHMSAEDQRRAGFVDDEGEPESPVQETRTGGIHLGVGGPRARVRWRGPVSTSRTALGPA